MELLNLVQSSVVILLEYLNFVLGDIGYLRLFVGFLLQFVGVGFLATSEKKPGLWVLLAIMASIFFTASFFTLGVGFGMRGKVMIQLYTSLILVSAVISFFKPGNWLDVMKLFQFLAFCGGGYNFVLSIMTDLVWIEGLYKVLYALVLILMSTLLIIADDALVDKHPLQALVELLVALVCGFVAFHLFAPGEGWYRGDLIHFWSVLPSFIVCAMILAPFKRNANKP